MGKNVFSKVWSGVLSSLALLPTKGQTIVPDSQFTLDGHKLSINAVEDSRPDLFLRQAKEIYGDSMQIAGHRSHSSHRSHRSHSSHRSHYSSRSYTPAPSYTPPSPSTAGSQNSGNTKSSNNSNNKQSSFKNTKKLMVGVEELMNATNVKMVQISLNLLGYNAGKVDGILGKNVKSALEKFQDDENIISKEYFNSQTCLALGRKIKHRFPSDSNASTLHRNLLRLYLKMTVPNN